jgi:hypothetical protein
VDWLEQLRRLPPERRLVAHEPPSPRYGRAAQKLRYIVQNAVLLGARRSGARVEIAVWCRPGHGRGAGYYACFRLEPGTADTLSCAVLFCSYDGRDQSPGFRSVERAAAFARENGFTPGAGP